MEIFTWGIGFKKVSVASVIPPQAGLKPTTYPVKTLRIMVAMGALPVQKTFRRSIPRHMM